MPPALTFNGVIDISHHNGVVDLKKAKGDGIVGVIHKATQGQAYMDPTYQANRTKAADAALLWGAYHFGTGADGVFVDVREMRDSRGNRARGIVVEIAGAQALREQSFVDADEIPGLLKAIDDLVAITANPTQFRSFEIRFMTRGEMGLTASSSRNRGIFYGVEVGRLTKVRKAISAGEMHQLRTLFEAASQKLATLVAEK